MNKNSIFFTVTVGFIISILLLILSFTILITVNNTSNSKKYIEKYYPIARLITRQARIGISQEFLESLREIDYELFTDTNKINAITYNAKTKVLFERNMVRHNNHGALYRVLMLHDKSYFYIKDKGTTFLLEDKSPLNHPVKFYIILIFVVLLVVISLVYYINIRKLKPLKLLKKKVENLGDEDFDFKYNTTSKDEISLLAVEFEKSAKKLKQIKEARNVFIRNIMHELKTPIIKGKFLTKLPKTDDNNQKMENVFLRLELLINEFSSIEEVISSTKQIQKANYFLNDIVDNAIDILLIDEDIVKHSFSNIKLNVNFKLFSIAVKNLIDNAIKYSNDGIVTIKTDENNIIFENSGNSLKYELDSYFEPFFANNEQEDSFGLGLYIINSILVANGYYLTYEYEGNINKFIIKKEDAK